MTEDLTDVIQASIEDATTPDEPVESSSEAVVDSANDLQTDTAPIATEAPAEAEPTEVASPAAQTPAEAKPAADDFDKKYGLTPQSTPGRENRIPYSRVRKIADKAALDAKSEVEKTWGEKYAQAETKIKDYEGRLGQVAQFEQIMSNNPQQFLEMLAKLPAYGQIFRGWAEAITQAQGQAPAQQAAPAAQAAPVADDMPQPDQTLPDGTKVYSMDGLKALNAWNRAQASKEAIQAVEQRYAPMEQEWRAQQQLQQIIPQVQRQIEEARKWPLFNESENEIVQALQQNPSMNLEGAYLRVVQPKILQQAQLTKEREAQIVNEARQKVFAELKQKPTTTTASASTAVRPTRSTEGKSRDLIDIIKEATDTLK